MRILAPAARPVLVRRYLSAYRGLRPLRPERLPYWEALACMRSLVRAAEESRQLPDPGDPPPAPLPVEAVVRRFASLTGVEPAP